jgi:hypothetical protein
MPDLHGWITQQIDRAGCWLVERDHFLTAELLWRACRMW